MSRVLHRYLGRELLRYWLVFTLVLWLVLVAARFSLYLGQAADGRLPADMVLWLLAFKSVGFLVFLMPLGLFLGLLALLGRLNQDCEALVMCASGMGPWQWYRAIAFPVLVIVALEAVLSGYLVPRTAAQGYQLRASAQRELEAMALTPGRFHSLRDGHWLLYAQGKDARSDTLENVFVHVRHARQPQVLVARQAMIGARDAGPARYLVLKDGYQYQGTPGRADYRVLRYRELALRLPRTRNGDAEHLDAVASSDLFGDARPAARAEWHQRVSRPLSVLVLALVALPLARARPGTGRYRPLWFGVLVFALYFNLLGVGQLWLEQQRLPAWAGLWWVHALVLAVTGAWALAAQRRPRRRAAT